ncbi:MAG: hypothetical protein LBR93_01690 [Treponema sp.]|jgi:hypothetical protein|nr:hypothetical protein [Treponema sp.]
MKLGANVSMYARLDAPIANAIGTPKIAKRRRKTSKKTIAITILLENHEALGFLAKYAKNPQNPTGS